MKLMVTIVDDRDVDNVLTALTGKHIGVTCVSSTGGLFVPGQSTLLIGIDEQHVPQAMKVINDLASPRRSFVPYMAAGNPDHVGGFTEVPVGGFQSFVLNLDHFEQV